MLQLNGTEHVPFHDIVAANHTPFQLDGSVNIDAIEVQEAHMLNNGVNAVFTCGTTGECSSLSSNERRTIAQRWVDVAHGTAMSVKFSHSDLLAYPLFLNAE